MLINTCVIFFIGKRSKFNGNIIRTNGKENINLPAYIITSAKIAAKIMVIDLMLLEIFLLDIFANQLSNK